MPPWPEGDLEEAVLGRALLRARGAAPDRVVPVLLELVVSLTAAVDAVLWLVDYRQAELRAVEVHSGTARLLRPVAVGEPGAGRALMNSGRNSAQPGACSSCTAR